LLTAEAARRATPVARLEDDLLKGADATVPFLVVRIPALERTAWREGMRQARKLERRACDAFAAAAGRVLRSGDLIAHDEGSDVFIAALTAPTRDGVMGSAPIDARSALARICATMEAATKLEIDTGWTVYSRIEDRDAIAAVIERALTRGAQERERYAFFSAIGHELRTPLSSIRGYLETLLDESIDAKTRQRFLTVAHNESLRLARLVEGMFEISLLDLQATFPPATTGSVERAIDAAIDACSAAASARAVTVVRPLGEAATVGMDSDRLTLVLINLIDNAIKHGDSNGTVRISSNVSDRRCVHIIVEDNGPGVCAEERERVFTLGERGQTEAAGSGIGLALVRLMLERVGARVDVDDSPIGGARFTVTLPRVMA
jgi:signal transduction histidine kinase